MNAYSLASGILVFVVSFLLLEIDTALSLFAAFGVAEALSLGQRLVRGSKEFGFRADSRPRYGWERAMTAESKERPHARVSRRGPDSHNEVGVDEVLAEV
jgi:hypothetical protein